VLLVAYTRAELSILRSNYQPADTNKDVTGQGSWQAYIPYVMPFKSIVSAIDAWQYSTEHPRWIDDGKQLRTILEKAPPDLWILDRNLSLTPLSLGASEKASFGD
jgi:hypothetical protein